MNGFVKRRTNAVFKDNFFLDKMFLKAVYILSHECRNIIPYKDV